MFSNQKILYLEDEPIISLDTSEHLESLGFGEVSVALKLSKADELAENTKFDFALLDINVDRGQTSIELGHKLAQNGTCVVFASGNGAEAERMRALGFSFLDKPFTLDQLTEMLALKK